MTIEDGAKFLKEFGPRVDGMFERLKQAAGVSDGPMSRGDLDILAAASMELLTLTLANMPEPMRGERVRGLCASMAADVAQKRKRVEQTISKGAAVSNR